MSAVSEPESPPRPRVYTGELISAVSALALVPIMFALEWFGTVGLPRSRRSGIETAVNAWHVLTTTRWVMLLAVVVALGSVVLHATQRAHGNRTDTSLVVAATATGAALLVAYRVLFALPDPRSVVDIKIGAYLGLLAAIGIALGGYDSIREQQARRDRQVRRARALRGPRLASRPQAR